MRSFLAGPPRGCARHLLSLQSHVQEPYFFWPLWKAEGVPACRSGWVGKLLGQERVRGLLPLWTGPDLKYLAERLQGPTKLVEWRRWFKRGLCNLLHPAWGLWSLQGCSTLAVTQRWHVWGFSKLPGWCVAFSQPLQLSPARAIAFFPVWQEEEGKCGRGPRDGWQSRSALPDRMFHPSSMFLPFFLHSWLCVIPDCWGAFVVDGAVRYTASLLLFSPGHSKPQSVLDSFILLFLGANGALWALADVRTYWYVYCLLWEVSWFTAQHLISLHSVPGGKPTWCWL